MFWRRRAKLFTDGDVVLSNFSLYTVMLIYKQYKLSSATMSGNIYTYMQMNNTWRDYRTSGTLKRKKKSFKGVTAVCWQNYSLKLQTHIKASS